jgi:GT2 family glycosyltransferase
MSKVHQKVCVLTVTYNNAESIERYFEGLLAQADAIGELVIVDNGSVDDTVLRLRASIASAQFPVTILESTNEGFGAGMNRAAAARSAIDLPLLCLNPDLVLARSVVAKMLTILRTAVDVAIVTAPLRDESGEWDSASVRSLPEVRSALAYSMVGRFLPSRMRYNGHEINWESIELEHESVAQIEATTGALMLLHPDFKSSGYVFDPDYWMYGEDLQLCCDAQQIGLKVLMARTDVSLHLKGLSSGRPRRLRSNWAFHNALFVYYRKNLNRFPIVLPIVHLGVLVRFAISSVSSSVTRFVRSTKQGRPLKPSAVANTSS